MIVHVITGLNQGGAEASLLRLLQASATTQRSHVVSLLDDEGAIGAQLRELGIPVTCLFMEPGKPSALAFIKLVRLLRRLQPRVVQTWMYHADLMGGLAARLVGVPVVWGIRHSDLSVSANKGSTLAVVKLCARLSRWIPSRIISCSKRAAQIHQAFGYAPKFVVIPNGLDLSRYFPDSQAGARKRAALAIPNDEIIVGHIGRFHPQKDYPTLLAACAGLNDVNDHFRLVMCGKNVDSRNSELRALLKSYSLESRVVLLGARDDVPQLLQAADILVLSSLGEAFPNVVAEAMATGVPCVVTDVGDAAEIVGETGWIVPAGDPVALGGALARALFESREVRAQRGRAARKRIEDNYDVSKMVAAYHEVWDEVVRERDLSCVA